MPSRQPDSPTTNGNVYRVYRVPDSVREAINSRAAGQTIRQFIAEVVEHRLPPLVATLAGAGLLKPEKTRPARLPMTRRLLQSLAAASEQTGVPASRLLLAILAAPPSTPGRRGKSRNPSTGGRKRGKRKAETPSAAAGDKQIRKRRTRSPQAGEEITAPASATEPVPLAASENENS
jgi:hypothetical protein